MRSTFIHIKGSGKQEVVDSLKGYNLDGIYIGYYDDHLAEYESKDAKALKERLGVFPPDVTVMADISGEIVGYQESLELAHFLLTRFSGLVQDDGAGLWSLDELLRDAPSDDGYFMEPSRRSVGLKFFKGEQNGIGNPLPFE